MERQRRAATYAMVLGLLAAGVIIGVGVAQLRNATRTLSALEAKCRSEHPKPSDVPKGYELVCDSGALAKDVGLSGIQAEIQKQFIARDDAWANIGFFALVVAVLFSIPRGWYFLVDRLAELSTAIRRGKSG